MGIGNGHRMGVFTVLYDNDSFWYSLFIIVVLSLCLVYFCLPVHITVKTFTLVNVCVWSAQVCFCICVYLVCVYAVCKCVFG